MSTLYSIGAMNQLGDALENAGFTLEDVTKLKQSGDLRDFKNVIERTLERRKSAKKRMESKIWRKIRCNKLFLM